MSSFLLRSSLSFLIVVVIVTSGVFTLFSRAREADKKFPGFQLEGASRETNPCTEAVSWMYDFAKDICRFCCGLPWPLTYCPSNCVDYITYCNLLYDLCYNNYNPAKEKVCCKSITNCRDKGYGACNPQTYECVDCTNGYHCTVDEPICDNYECRPCISDNECESNYNGHPYCKNGKCWECITDDKENCYDPYDDWNCCNNICCYLDPSCTGYADSRCKVD